MERETLRREAGVKIHRACSGSEPRTPSLFTLRACVVNGLLWGNFLCRQDTHSGNGRDH